MSVFFLQCHKTAGGGVARLDRWTGIPSGECGLKAAQIQPTQRDTRALIQRCYTWDDEAAARAAVAYLVARGHRRIAVLQGNRPDDVKVTGARPA